MKNTEVSKYANTFGGRLEWLKWHCKTSNNAMAKKVGISEATIRNYADGGMPNLENAIKIADTFKVSFEWLCKGFGEPFPQEDIDDGIPLTIELAHAEKAAYDLQVFQDKYNITFSPYEMQNLMRFVCIQYQEGHDVPDMSLRQIHQLIKKPPSDS